ncbi:MAG: hypothetical protein Kow00104_13350 [Rhodothalassiaceae bacterium]
MADHDREAQTGPELPPTIAQTHREALALAREASAVIADRARVTRFTMSMEGQAIYAAETLRMSSRILHVVAWTLNRKAVAAGEISESEAAAPSRRLGGEEVCLAEPVGDLGLLPPPIRHLIETSGALYERVLRLERMMLDRAPQDGLPPVRAMQERLRDLEP